MVDLVNVRVEQEAIRNEAQYEPGTSRKIYFAEEYELAKYPAQEAHYFVNILRKQRAGPTYTVLGIARRQYGLFKHAQ